MKKWQLIAKAYQDYPKGTKFKDEYKQQEVVSSGEFNIVNKAVVARTNKGVSIVYSPLTNGEKWAEIVEKKEPLLVSEDGLPLYEGDPHSIATQCASGKWSFAGRQNLKRTHMVITHPKKAKAFLTNEYAQAWIECANENLQNYQLERLTDKKGYIFVVNHKGTLITYIAKDKQEAEGFSDLWKGFNYTINEITLPKEQ